MHIHSLGFIERIVCPWRVQKLSKTVLAGCQNIKSPATSPDIEFAEVRSAASRPMVQAACSATR
jgi:hypothetical protein